MKLQSRRRKRLSVLVEDQESKDVHTVSTLHPMRLQIVHPGKFVVWDGQDDQSGVSQIWELCSRDSGTNIFGGDDTGQDDDSDDSVDEKGGSRKISKKYDDPMLNVMWKELQAQKKVKELIDFKLEQDRKAWATTNYKLTSMEGKGDAELIRLLFVYAGEAYDDERITADHWEELKPKTPYHNLPVLSKCGKQWGETGAIVRVLARRFLLMGVTNDENLVVEATYERLRRLKRQNERAINWVITGEKNKERQEWAQSQLLHVILPPAMKEWDQLITTTEGPFVASSGISMADLAIMDFLDQCSSCMMIDGLFSDHLAVADLYSMVRLFPKIAAYLDERSDA